MQDYLKYIFLSALAALAPVHAIMISVGVLIFADLVTGIIAAHKRKEPISSAALRRTVTKMFVYQLVIVSAFLLETHMIQNLLPVSKLAASVIGMVEFKSLIENCNEILGKDLFSELLKRLGSKNDDKGS